MKRNTGLVANDSLLAEFKKRLTWEQKVWWWAMTAPRWQKIPAFWCFGPVLRVVIGLALGQELRNTHD